MCLACQTGDTPARDHAIETLSLGSTDDIDHLVLSKNVLNLHLLLEESHQKVNLLCCSATVYLDLLDVSLLLADGFVHLRVTNSTNHLAVLLGSFDLCVHGSSLLAFLTPLLLILGEGLLLGIMPILVETPLALLRQMTSPNRGQSTEATRSFHVSHEAHHPHWWTLQNGHWLYDLFLVQLGAWSVHLSDNVGHSCLVAHEGSEVGLLGCIVLRKALDLAVMMPSALPGQKSQGSVTRALKLSVRHDDGGMRFFLTLGC
mmetsp:Transcript_144990/g.205183  ORF Transcript_144990/g.205183 Transcript_144990/m.205183 type:complete len:259 (+) Transcript_144990:530-1306(+)